MRVILGGGCCGALDKWPLTRIKVYELASDILVVIRDQTMRVSVYNKIMFKNKKYLKK